MKVRRLPVDPGPAAWNTILPPADRYSQQQGTLRCKVAVVGGGFAGLSAAQRLIDLGEESVVVLEAKEFAEGPAGRNSGFMIDLPHELNSDGYTGQAGAQKREIELNRIGIDYAAELARRAQMPAQVFEQAGRVTGASTRAGEQHLVEYRAQLDQLDEASRWVDAADMQAMTGTDFYHRGLYTPSAAIIQPAAYVRALTRLLATRAQLFENSPVTEFEQRAGGWVLNTPTGQVQADRVVLAVNGHLQSFGFLPSRLLHVFTYASMTEPLSSDQLARLGGAADWGMLPADPMGTTVRKFSDYQGAGDRIVIRNHATLNQSIETSPADMKRAAKLQQMSFDARFPMLQDVKFEHRWGGRLCLSLNSTHAFGEIAPGLFSACCQNGLGTAKGMLAGKLIADMMKLGPEADGVSDFLALPEPSRLPPQPFLSIGARLTMRYKEHKAGREL